jgi:hypothetical protein
MSIIINKPSKKMKAIIKTTQWCFFVFLVFQTTSFAQIKVGDNPTMIHSSAVLEIESANKGLLLPRLALTNATAATPLSEHVAGMIVYNTSTANGLTAGFYYNDGAKWIGISQSTATGLLTAENGLSNDAGVVSLGGNLTKPTTLNTTAINTLAIKGLVEGSSAQGDFVIIDKTTGALKTIPSSVIDEKLTANPKIISGSKTKITYDEKGLVIRGEEASIADIKDLQNELDAKANQTDLDATNNKVKDNTDALALKANQTDLDATNIKVQANTDALALKANIDSPAFTGTPKTVSISAVAADNAIANKKYVDEAIITGIATSVPNASEIVSGKVRLANTGEVAMGSDNTLAVSPKNLKTELDKKANLDAPVFTGNPKSAAAPSADDDVTNVKYVKDAVAAGNVAVVSQTVDAGKTTTAPSEDAVRKELNLKANQSDLVNTNTKVSANADAISLKADKANGAQQITDPNVYSIIGNSAGATQADINFKIDEKLNVIKTSAESKADKTGGVAQITDPNAHPVVNTAAGALQSDVNTAIDAAIGQRALATEVETKKADKTNGATQITDPTAYTAIGSGAGNTQAQINAAIDSKFATNATSINGAINDKADKAGGVAQVTDPGTYGNIGVNTANQTQATINSAVNTTMATKASLAGAAFTGAVTVPNPVNATEAANKQYVDDIKITIDNTKADKLNGVAQISDNNSINNANINAGANATQATINTAINTRLGEKAPLADPLFTTDVKTTVSTTGTSDPKALTTKDYVDTAILNSDNSIYAKDGTLSSNRIVTLGSKSVTFKGNNGTTDTGLQIQPNGNTFIGYDPTATITDNGNALDVKGNVNTTGDFSAEGKVYLKSKSADPNAILSAIRFVNTENGPTYRSAAIVGTTGSDKTKGQLVFGVNTGGGGDIATEAMRISEKTNLLIGTQTDDASAVLNVQSTTKGVLMPKQTATQRTAIPAPATGLQVYQTDGAEGQYFKTSEGWKRVTFEGDNSADYFEAINNTGSTINGTSSIPVIVGIDGQINNLPALILADANDHIDLTSVMGFVIESVPSGAKCKVYRTHTAENVNTAGTFSGKEVTLFEDGTYSLTALPKYVVTVGMVTIVDGTHGSIEFSVYKRSITVMNQYETTDVNDNLYTVFRSNIDVNYTPSEPSHVTNKRYVDQAIATNNLYQGAWNAETNTPALKSSTDGVLKGWEYDITVGTTTDKSWSNMCSGTPIEMLKGGRIKFDGNCWVYLGVEIPEASDTRNGVVRLATGLYDTDGPNDVAKLSTVKPIFDNIELHKADKTNPHNVTAAQLSDSNAYAALGTAAGASQQTINASIDAIFSAGSPLKADKLNGASQITDANANLYSNIGSLNANDTQQSINNAINTKLASQLSSSRRINTTAPIFGGGDLTADRTLSITQANATTNGYLSSADWNTFNNKQNAMSLTTTGNSGAATITGSTLNVPNYSLAGLGGQPLLNGTGLVLSNAGAITYITNNSANWDTAFNERGQWDGGATNLVASTGRTSLGGTTIGQSMFTLPNPSAVTFPRFNADNTVTALDAAGFRAAIGAGTGAGTVTNVGALTITSGAGSDLSSTVANATTTPVITLNVPTASATQRGALSAADWAMFNSKQGAINLTTTGTSGTASLNTATNTLNIPAYSLAGLGGQTELDGIGLVRMNNKVVSYDNTPYAPLASPVFTGTPTAPTVTPSNDSSTKLATTAFVQNAITSGVAAAVPDATNSVKGKIQLAGDLAGTAAAPTVISGNEGTAGKIQLATAAETTTGTINTKAVHPAGLKVELDKKAPLASPLFTGDARAVTPAVADNDTSVATTAFVQAAVNAKIPTQVVDEFTATAGQTSFTLSNSPLGTTVRLFINGVRIDKDAVSVTGNTATYTPAQNGTYNLTAGDAITIDYIK